MPALSLTSNATEANRFAASVMASMATGMRPMIGFGSAKVRGANPITPLVR